MTIELYEVDYEIKKWAKGKAILEQKNVQLNMHEQLLNVDKKCNTLVSECLKILDVKNIPVEVMYDIKCSIANIYISVIIAEEVSKNDKLTSVLEFNSSPFTICSTNALELAYEVWHYNKQLIPELLDSKKYSIPYHHEILKSLVKLTTELDIDFIQCIVQEVRNIGHARDESAVKNKHTDDCCY